MILFALFITFKIGVMVPNFLRYLQLNKMGSASTYQVVSPCSPKARLKHCCYCKYRYKKILLLPKTNWRSPTICLKTLTDFNSGVMVTGGEGQPVFLTAVENDKAKRIVGQALDIWLSYKQKLIPILTAKILLNQKSCKRLSPMTA